MAPRMFSPPVEAQAFRLWAWARDRDWNCTMLEASEALAEPVERVARVAQLKGWSHRFRAGSADVNRSHRRDGVRELDGIPMIGIDGLEAMGVHYGF